MTTCLDIAVTDLTVSAWHHRTLWGDLNELRDSILAHGVIEPLVVRVLADTALAKSAPDSHLCEIVCGVRRFKASRLANLSAVPCIVLDLSDEDAIAMQVAENRERQGLHPMDEAMYFDDLHRRGVDNAAIAKRFQLKQRNVVRRLRLLALNGRSRKAFTDGLIDEEAAIAMASVDGAKQVDILAALDAQAMNPDDVASYVQRTFMAQLDDVPWRMSDADLVLPAGACSKCPKRSDVQRDLFGEQQVGLKCLDVDCHRSKMDATWQALTPRLVAGEMTVLDETSGALFIPAQAGSRPVVMRSSGMVDEQADCPHISGLTWSEAIDRVLKPGAERPTLYVARDQDGRPRYLLRESIASKLVKKSDAAKEAAAEKQAARDPATVDEGTTTRAENKIRRATVARFAELVTASDYDTWAWVAERCVRNAMPRTRAQVAELLIDAILKLDTPAADDEMALIELTRASNRQARRVATAVMVFEESDVVGEIGPALHVLASMCDMDISAVEREVRAAARKADA